MRLAVLSSRKQRLVWKSVKEQQNKLSKKLNKLVANAQSPSSLQLTLEDKDLQVKINAYVTRLEKCIAGKSDVVGIVATINGKVESADVYGSATLFRKMWPKLLRSLVVFAFTEQSAGRRFEAAETAVEETRNLVALVSLANMLTKELDYSPQTVLACEIATSVPARILGVEATLLEEAEEALPPLIDRQLESFR